MKYSLNNKQSLGFRARRVLAPITDPLLRLYRFIRSIDMDIRTSEHEDFDIFANRTIDPERTRSVFA